MNNRELFQLFDEYQQSRMRFVQSVAELANKPQHSAVVATGRIANHSPRLADELITQGVLGPVLPHLSEDNKYHKKAACFVIRSVAKHTEALAQTLVDGGVIPPLITCLSDFDSGVKESAVWALGNIARHSEKLAQLLVDAGAVPLLVQCVREPELALRRISVSTLSDIAKHTESLARTVIDSGIVPHLVREFAHSDTGLKRQVTACLAQVAKHSAATAEAVVAAGAIEKSVFATKDYSDQVRKNACTLLRELSRHTEELANQVVMAAGLAALTEYLSDTSGLSRLPALSALGQIASFSETLAQAVVTVNAIPLLKVALIQESDDTVRAAAAFTLGEIGKHSSEHARTLAEQDVLRRLLAVYLHAETEAELRRTVKKSLKRIILKVTQVAILEPMLQDAPAPVLKTIVQQLGKVLANDIGARKHLVQSGALQRLQQLHPKEEEKDGAKLAKHLTHLYGLFPEEVIAYFSPQYSEQLVKKIDEFAAATNP